MLDGQERTWREVRLRALDDTFSCATNSSSRSSPQVSEYTHSCDGREWEGKQTEKKYVPPFTQWATSTLLYSTVWMQGTIFKTNILSCMLLWPCRHRSKTSISGPWDMMKSPQKMSTASIRNGNLCKTMVAGTTKCHVSVVTAFYEIL